MMRYVCLLNVYKTNVLYSKKELKNLAKENILLSIVITIHVCLIISKPNIFILQTVMLLLEYGAQPELPDSEGRLVFSFF